MPTVRWKDNPKEYHNQWYQDNKEKCNAQSKAWAKAHPDRTVAATRKWKFGLTAEEQKEICSGLCKVCNKKPATHIDHCHKTNKIRGGLCNNCNTGLGMFKDDPELLDAAGKYLREVPASGSYIAPASKSEAKRVAIQTDHRSRLDYTPGP